MKHIGIIGAGKWGLALDHAFSQKNSVLISSRTKRDIENFVSLDEVLKREYLVITIPAQSTRQWLKAHFKDEGQKILVATKGIETKTGAFLNDIYAEYISLDKVAFLSGPSFAAEVVQSLPTALCVSSQNEQLSKEFTDAFPDFIKGYSSKDVIGAEVAGAYKNVIAIAGGVCDGLALGNNARAALISRGLVEMSRFGMAFGAKMQTFLSLGGAGDLFLSASSKLSRNYRVGLGLSRSESIEQILKSIGEVAEGVDTARALHAIAEKNNIYLPIADEVYEMIELGKRPQDSLRDLLS